MIKTVDVHRQFSDYFSNKTLAPYLYLLSKRFSDGHICLDLDDINSEELKEAGFKNIANIDVLFNSEIIGSETDYQPFILWKNKLYMQRYFLYEQSVYEKIKDFITTEEALEEINKNHLLQSREMLETLFPADKLGITDWQMIAAISVVLNQFNIITGGPGTGKTTTVAKILSLLLSLNPNLKVALAAPTGKAAARMAESLKSTAADEKMKFDENTKALFASLEPSTIHRLLGARPDAIYFKHNRHNPIPHDLIIVDESSMIDVALFSKLLDALKPDAKVIFLGDKDQLASVEAGSLFGDLCTIREPLNLFTAEKTDFINSIIPNSKLKLIEAHSVEKDHLLFEHIIELQHSYRFAAGGNIGVFSKAIIENDRLVLHQFLTTKFEDIIISSKNQTDDLLKFSDGYRAYIQEKDIKKALQKLNDLRVLCAMREGKHGLYQTNRDIEKHLQENRLISITGTFYEHRPIIVTGNNYELGLYNGDIGIVRKDENGRLKVWFEDANGNLRGILPAFINAAETVFAMTIHKSQGSEFKDVLVRLPESADNALLTRELLYTAVTRAKQKVIVQGSAEVILPTCQRKVKRGSGIAERFKA